MKRYFDYLIGMVIDFRVNDLASAIIAILAGIIIAVLCLYVFSRPLLAVLPLSTSKDKEGGLDREARVLIAKQLGLLFGMGAVFLVCLILTYLYPLSFWDLTGYLIIFLFLAVMFGLVRLDLKRYLKELRTLDSGA